MKGLHVSDQTDTKLEIERLLRTMRDTLAGEHPPFGNTPTVADEIRAVAACVEYLLERAARG